MRRRTALTPDSPHPGTAPSPARGGVPSLVPLTPDTRLDQPALPLTVAPPRPTRRRGWPRTLRWRLTLAYAGALAALALVLGLVLNALVGNLLYREEFTTFQNESRVTINRQQHRFDVLVQGAATATPAQGDTCADAVSYQQAFAETIAAPLIAYHQDVRQVFLLDASGNVLAPDDDPGVVGQRAPALRPLDLAQLWIQARGIKHSGTGLLTDVHYMTAGPDGRQMGVLLVAERYHTTSRCINPRNTAVGIIEIVTDFADTSTVLAKLRLMLLLSVAGMLALGILIGAPLMAQALKPLTRMTQTAQRIASGDLSQRVRLPHGGDEIGQLADTFDEMIARIQAAFGAQAASETRMRQFVADASHELRTPLTAIRGYIDVLLRGAARDDPATAEQVLFATQREAERMSRLVNDLLTLARLDGGRPLERQPIDLIALTGEAVDQARILAGERQVSLATDGAGRLVVPLDPDRMKQVLLILLDNALKYGRPAPDGWVRVYVSRTGRGAVVSVTDNGQGIAPEDLGRIFDRFYRGERAARQRRMTGAQVAAVPGEPPVPREGSPPASASGASMRGQSGAGLGLAIAQAIVRAHGGTLTVESQVGVGTTFTLALPLA